MKKKKAIALLVPSLLGSVLLTACDDAPNTNRDVYASKEECLRDWNDGDLCQEMDATDANQYRSEGDHGHVIVPHYFWGPTYYPHDRSVVYKGQTITPVGKSTTLRPFTVSPRSSSASRTSPSSPRVTSTGGFGGRSVGTGGS
jgi:hypothetical protein